jgi:hypothetical protein
MSLLDRGRFTRRLTDADFTDVAVTAETQTLRFDSFDAYWSLVESGAIRIGLTLRELSDDARRSARAEPHERLSPLRARGGLAMPSEALVAAGRIGPRS